MLQEINQVLLLNETSHNIEIGGSFVYVASASGQVKITLDNETEIICDKGSNIKVERFNSIALTNKHNGVNTLKIILGRGEYNAGISVLGTIETYAARSNGHKFETKEIDGVVELYNYDDTRTSSRVSNVGISVVFIGNTDVLNTNYALQVGEVLDIKHSQILALYASGAGGSISIFTEHDNQQATTHPQNLINETITLTHNGEVLTHNGEPLTHTTQ